MRLPSPHLPQPCLCRFLGNPVDHYGSAAAQFYCLYIRRESQCEYSRRIALLPIPNQALILGSRIGLRRS